MPDDRTSRLLDEFSAVTNAAPRPESPARRHAMQNRFPVATLTGASLVIVTVAVAALIIGRSGPAPLVGSSSSPSASQATAPTPSAIAAAGPTATPKATQKPSAPGSPKPTPGPCNVAHLTSRITLWEGAAGSRIAHVELKNDGSAACLLDKLDRPQLVDGSGRIRIDGQTPPPSGQLTLEPGAVVSTLVSASNDCGPDPQPPVTVAFVFAVGLRLVAEPVSPTDTTTPPCNGAGSPAAIDMHPWAR
jgi:hypothetical protein